jgi:uncharacterized protein (TIGR03382 family)
MTSIFTPPLTGNKQMQINGYTAPLAALIIGLTLTANTHAGIIDYSFSGTAGSGSFLNLGSGPVNISGAAFTATGTLLNDTDIIPGDPFVGVFAATTNYDFGAFGVFITNNGADFYVQSQGSTTFVAGLSEATAQEGIFPIGIGTPFADPNISQAVGMLSFNDIPSNSVLRTQTNAAGHSLTLAVLTTVPSANITASGQAPLPGTLPLMALALAALGLRRRT